MPGPRRPPRPSLDKGGAVSTSGPDDNAKLGQRTNRDTALRWQDAAPGSYFAAHCDLSAERASDGGAACSSWAGAAWRRQWGSCLVCRQRPEVKARDPCLMVKTQGYGTSKCQGPDGPDEVRCVACSGGTDGRRRDGAKPNIYKYTCLYTSYTELSDCNAAAKGGTAAPLLSSRSFAVRGASLWSGFMSSRCL